MLFSRPEVGFSRVWVTIEDRSLDKSVQSTPPLPRAMVFGNPHFFHWTLELSISAYPLLLSHVCCYCCCYLLLVACLVHILHLFPYLVHHFPNV